MLEITPRRNGVYSTDFWELLDSLSANYWAQSKEKRVAKCCQWVKGLPRRWKSCDPSERLRAGEGVQIKVWKVADLFHKFIPFLIIENLVRGSHSAILIYTWPQLFGIFKVGTVWKEGNNRGREGSVGGAGNSLLWNLDFLFLFFFGTIQ